MIPFKFSAFPQIMLINKRCVSRSDERKVKPLEKKKNPIICHQVPFRDPDFSGVLVSCDLKHPPVNTEKIPTRTQIVLTSRQVWILSNCAFQNLDPIAER